MIWIILGMHKSGTTLVSKILHESGINMVDGPENRGVYDSGNKMERSSTKAVNHAILGSSDKFSLDVAKPETLNLGSVQQQMMLETISTCNASNSDWGFKDPRTCFTYALWNAHLGDHRLVAVFRSPKEVWGHYWASARFYQKLEIFLKFIPRWCEYNSAILHALESADTPYILVDYSALMTRSDEWSRLQGFVGRQLHDSRRSGMYRKRSTSSMFYKMALALHRIAGGPDPDLILSRLSDIRIAQTGDQKKKEVDNQLSLSGANV
jgi:hypothetical protein